VIRRAGWLLAHVALLAAACGAAGGEQNGGQLEVGRRVYDRERCATCHAIAGKGNRRYPLDGVGSRLSRDDVRKWVVAPQEMQQGVRKRSYRLPEAELEALVAYLMTLEE
jgi:mono/diheme cytochrome c family protein